MTVPTRTNRPHHDSQIVSRGGPNLDVERPIATWAALPATTEAPLPWPSIIWVGSVIRHEMDGIMPVPGTRDLVPIRFVSIGVGAAATRPGHDGIHPIRLDTHRFLIAGARWVPPGLALEPMDELGRGRLMVDGVASGAGAWPTIAERATELRRRRMQSELAHVMLRVHPASLLMVRGNVPSGIGGSRVMSWQPSVRHVDLPEPVKELARTLVAGQRTPLFRLSEATPPRYRCLVGGTDPTAAARPLAHVVTIETRGVNLDEARTLANTCGNVVRSISGGYRWRYPSSELSRQLRRALGDGTAVRSRVEEALAARGARFRRAADLVRRVTGKV